MVKKKAPGPSSKSQPPRPIQQDTSTPKVEDASTVREQQRLLNIFSDTFSNVLSSPGFDTTLQSIKQALFERDFARAFSTEEHLEAYAARWSPTRALCYVSILRGIHQHLQDMCQLRPGAETEAPENHHHNQHPASMRVLAIGGAAAETAAFAAYTSSAPSPPGLRTEVDLVDSAPWQAVVANLTGALTRAPALSRYASEAARAANAALVIPDRFAATLHQRDALQLVGDTGLLGGGGGSGSGSGQPVLVTLLFTLNELFTASGIGKTTALLLHLGAALPRGSLLLVVDSPGSYAEAAVGKQAKRYPMQWLLDKILLAERESQANSSGSGSGTTWEKLESHDSVWFRLSTDLDYPIPLENMRYQMHLYQLVSPSAPSSSSPTQEETAKPSS